MPERTALLIDWGGVLTTDVFASFEAFCVREGLSAQTARESFRTDPVAREALIGLETGVLSELEFELMLAPVLGVEPDQLIKRMNADVVADPRMLSAVGQAREFGLATGLISNSWGLDWYGPELLELFDGVVISGRHGMRKPAPEMYAMGARAVRREPAECVYVDDIGGNLKPARDMGMATIHHVDAERTIAELSSLFGLPFAGIER